jgi:hypothetical protein
VRVLNFGSLNLDHFYEVVHVVRLGETIPSGKYRLTGKSIWRLRPKRRGWPTPRRRGITLTGFFIAQKPAGKPINDCLRTVRHAAATCVTLRWAADSIPWMKEVLTR